MNDPAPAQAPTSTLSSRRGIAILLLLSVVQFMDILDASILNIALPSIKTDLGFSQQSLQWVVNGYILTYGGFLLLGGRMADLLGRRSVLVTGLIVFAASSLLGGLAHTSSLLVGARFAQGIGAAMMSPAALSTLTSTFRSTVIATRPRRLGRRLGHRRRRRRPLRRPADRRPRLALGAVHQRPLQRGRLGRRLPPAPARADSRPAGWRTSMPSAPSS